MNPLDKQYLDLLHAINEYGVVKQDRTGTGTRSIFGYTIRHNMKDGFPLLTTKKMAWKQIVTELIWFLRGDTNIKFLVDNDCHIWDGDAYKNYEKTVKASIDKATKEGVLNNDESEGYNYLNKESFIERIKTDDEFSQKWGELGPIYGKQWRSWGEWSTIDEPKKIIKPGVDQIANLINDLKTNPDSRRLMVSAWNVGELDQMVLPPCHYGFQVYTRELGLKERFDLWEQLPERDVMDFPIGQLTEEQYHEVLTEIEVPKRAISLMWNQRSVDTFLGLPFNIASYGLLLEIIAKTVNMVPDQLIGNLGDTHLYLNHTDAVEEQLGRYYTPEERHELLKKAMGDFYQTAVEEQVPFGGGLSEYYEGHKIPKRTREPYPLPTLNIQKTSDFWKDFTVDQFSHLDTIDFQIENYQSHPTIKAPLSN